MARGVKAKKGRSESGQATVEFALTLILLMGFVLFFVQMSLMSAWGNYVHYATFMAARAQLSAGPTQAEQEDRAKAVLVRMLKKSQSQSGADRFPYIARGEGGGDPKGAEVGAGNQYQEGVRNLSWMVGVRYTFKSRLFLIPFAGQGKAGTANSLTLTSESWLGREPSSSDCLDAMGQMSGIIDNGC